ncbi:hypothetical protein DTO207G8_4110 [Paecilomyces variotii]|nr:hypothetical protein DTO169E5_6767 [Paecilomyces variotii]KAJ9253686.1 hypothetical protein DTO207G8_4110 [Paecilomyces variotii]KAJ9387125.1 hypothetical protein DTO063F5_3220 [Paecilomyces variotii]
MHDDNKLDATILGLSRDLLFFYMPCTASRLKATMSPRIKTDPNRMISQSLQALPQGSRPMHPMHGMPSLTSTASQDDDLSSQDRFSLSSHMQSNQTSHGMEGWAMTSSGSIDSTDMTPSEPESPEVQMLSFSLSQQLMPSSHGDSANSGSMYSSLSDFQAVQEVTDNDMDFTQAQDFHQFSSMVDFSYDHDTCTSSGTQGCTPDDAASVGHGSQNDDTQMMAASDAWSSLAMDTGSFHGSTLDHLSSHIFHPVPVSPPLTEASNDMSVTSSCSNSGYSFHTHEDAFFGDLAPTTIGGQTINLGDPLFPLTPPLSEQDPNRTIRPSKQAQRPLLSAATSRNQRKSDPEFYSSLSVREPLRQRSKDGSEIRAPRDHPYYSLPTQADGKYYCPFATGDKPCNHPPTTQKCAYHKYLDSHLKPYRCKVPACMDAQLQFSSNACLFRHEREAHGLHGHGDNPHLCLFEGCDRSVPGYGFPRRWNLFDHMKRVHDYTSSERPSSPETAPGVLNAKKKDTVRKRKVTGPTAAQTMKRTRSTHSQANPLKAAHATAHLGQRLQNAERNYYNCRSRLLEEISNITPQDPAIHEKVNASLQELITLGLNYRHIEASQAATQMNGSAST